MIRRLKGSRTADLVNYGLAKEFLMSDIFYTSSHVFHVTVSSEEYSPFFLFFFGYTVKGLCRVSNANTQ
jgi:hypothetical protein